MTAKQLSAVPCPRCGAETGKGCLEPSGTLRAGPHVDRRLSAIEAVEVKRCGIAASANRSAISSEHEDGILTRWVVTTRIARGLSRKHHDEYVVTNPHSLVTHGPFSSEVKAKEQANKLNHLAPVPQIVRSFFRASEFPSVQN
jgi:hypothetical protein